MRIMAIDYGDARTGVALSDPTGFLAGQTFLIKSRKEDVVLEELAALAQKQGAEELVMGSPRNMDGTLGPRAEKYAAFAERLKERTGLPQEESEDVTLSVKLGIEAVKRLILADRAKEGK